MIPALAVGPFPDIDPDFDVEPVDDAFDAFDPDPRRRDVDDAGPDDGEGAP